MMTSTAGSGLWQMESDRLSSGTGMLANPQMYFSNCELGLDMPPSGMTLPAR